MSQEATSRTAQHPASAPDRTLDEVWIRNLLDASDEVIYFKDLQSRFIRVSLGCAALHGRTQEQLQGLTDFDLFDDRHSGDAYADEQLIIATGRPMINKEECETWVDKPDSWVASSKFPLRDLDGTVIGTFGISRDITRRVLLEREMVTVAKAASDANAELARVEAQLRSVLDSSTDAISQYGTDLRYRYLNPAGERLRGLSREELVGLTDREAGMPDVDADMWETAVRRVLETGSRGELEFATVVPGGQEGWFHTTLSPQTDPGGTVTGVLTSTRDVTANKIAERALAHQALHDAVTGLANRYLLMDRLGRALLRLERAPGHVVLYFIDVDHFKSVNDTYGHDVGDLVLVELARRLTSVARREDTVARIGGDEFVVLCESVLSEAHVGEIAGRLVHALAEPFREGPVQVQLSASVGAAVATDPAAHASDLLRNADSAMYRAKEGGRNAFHVFDPDAVDETGERHQLEEELQHALVRGQLSLAYQPLLSLADQRVLGFEALLRWEHPTKGTVTPLELIPIAERIGMMGPIGAWVLDEACRTLARWTRLRPPDSEPLSMAVNLSGSQLRAPGLVELVADTLHEHEISPPSLRLEISERALTSDDPGLGDVLRELGGLGVQLAVDDFGATASSLARLPRFPVSVVKLGRFADVRQRELLAAVVATAHSLGMSVVGGGIEDASQLAELNALACDDGQGFLLGRPLDERAAEELLGSRGGSSGV